MESKYVKLSEVASVLNSTVDKKSRENEEKVKLCNYVDIYKHWSINFSFKNDFMNATATQKEILNFSLKKGQVAFTKDSEKRDDIGVSTYISEDMNGVLLGYHTTLVTPNKEVLDGAYLNAYFNSKFMQKYFELNASGSGQRFTLSIEVLNDIPVKLIHIEEQRKIGLLFTYIAKKINNNNKIINELQELSKLIYNYWFVQFDFPNEEGKPYKLSGGKMVWNEELKREIPEGWEVSDLNYFVTFVNKKELPDKRKKLIDLSVISSNTLVQNEFNSGDFSDTNLFELQEGDILFGSIRPYLKKYAIAPFDGLVAGTIHSMRVKNLEYHSFITNIIMSDPFIGYAINSSEGTKMPVIKKEMMQKFPIVYNNKIVNMYSNLTSLKLVSNLIKQTHSLIEIRDFLLPLLMNGQVKIRDEE